MLLLLAACSVARHGASGFGLLGGPSQGCSAGFKHVLLRRLGDMLGLLSCPAHGVYANLGVDSMAGRRIAHCGGGCVRKGMLMRSMERARRAKRIAAPATKGPHRLSRIVTIAV